ncbi:hypothetical protein H8D29_05770 [PVC group bacterium]|nr:hypothetical protein [PVC group bacterium]
MRRTLIAIASCILGITISTYGDDEQNTQTNPLIQNIIPLRVTSGIVRNIDTKQKAIFQHLVFIDGASSMQIQFGRTKLPQGTVLRMTSILDGAVQHHQATTLKQWQHKSAWFNGSMVIVELVAEPHSAAAHVSITGASVVQNGDADRSICGNSDDRVLSYDDRCGRAVPIGCTAWLIDDPNHTFLTAGHCADGGVSDIQTVEFNVPLSDANGNIQHPGPEDQYATDPSSIQVGYTGIGDDWSYFGCFPNTETGLTPFQAQGVFHVLSNAAPPVSGQLITITGYGSVTSPVDPSWYLVQKTHTGPYTTQSSTSIAYQTDTSGGNSGSAVLNESTGEAIGIHTNAGCNSGGGENWGCAIHNSGLQNALANPQGVCIPNIMYYQFPNGIPNAILPQTTMELQFSVVAGEEIPDPNSVTLVLTVNSAQQYIAATSLGNDLYSVILPSFICDDVVSFYIQTAGDGGSVVYSPAYAPADQYEIAIGTLVETLLFEQNFNAGIPADWTTSGLWNATTNCVPSGTCEGGIAAYFGIVGQCSYDNGTQVTGILTSPSIPMGGATSATLTYFSSLETENLSGYDVSEVRVNGVFADSPAEAIAWEERVVQINNDTGNPIVIEWSFDSIDSIYNSYRGWHVDGIRLSTFSLDCTATNPCPADINGDSSVTVSDLLTVIDQWGTSGSADINSDGIVDVSDLLEIVGSWGPC